MCSLFSWFLTKPVCVWDTVVSFHHTFGTKRFSSQAGEDGENTVAVSHFEGCVLVRMSVTSQLCCWTYLSFISRIAPLVKIKGSMVSPNKSPSYTLKWNALQNGDRYYPDGKCLQNIVNVCLSKVQCSQYRLWGIKTIVSFLLWNVMAAFLK